MIRVPTQLAVIIASLWAVGIAYTSHLPHLPGWAPYAIAGGGVLLAGFGINVPQAPTILDSSPPSTGDASPRARGDASPEPERPWA
jgi:hypothetical protein